MARASKVKKSFMLRTCAADGTAYGGFRWPLTVGTEVVSPDWDPRVECGGGLHGLADGAGDGAQLQANEPERIGMVCSYEPSEAVEIGGKIKVPRCVIEFIGTLGDAAAWLRDRLPPERQSLCYAGTATAGDAGTATAGYAGTATAGTRGTATAGDAGTARAGDDGIVTIQRWTGGKYRCTVGVVGETIEAWVWYVVDDMTGQLRKATDDELRAKNIDPATNGVRP